MDRNECRRVRTGDRWMRGRAPRLAPYCGCEGVGRQVRVGMRNCHAPKGERGVGTNFPNTFAPHVRNNTLTIPQILMGLQFGFFKWENLPDRVKAEINKIRPRENEEDDLTDGVKHSHEGPEGDRTWGRKAEIPPWWCNRAAAWSGFECKHAGKGSRHHAGNHVARPTAKGL